MSDSAHTLAAPPTDEIARSRKAAMIVQMLIGDGGKLPLNALPPEHQTKLAHELGEIRVVDRSTVHAVALEFMQELGAIGLSSPGGTDAAVEALADHISPEIAVKLRSELAAATDGDPWSMILSLDDGELLHLMQIQSVEICAVTLSKLPVAKAADILTQLPGSRARRITYAISETQDISPSVVRSIGQALVGDHCGARVTAFEKAPDARLGAILNSSPTQTRETLLRELDQQDAGFAASVRENIFTFKDIATRVAALDVPQCIRGVPAEDLTMAIAFAQTERGDTAEAAEFLLANISQRMSAQIREEADELGTVTDSDADAAMRAVSAEIMALADAGSITLLSAESDAN